MNRGLDVLGHKNAVWGIYTNYQYYLKERGKLYINILRNDMFLFSIGTKWGQL